MSVRKKAVFAAIGSLLLYLGIQFGTIGVASFIAFYRAIAQNPALDGVTFLSEFLNRYSVELLFASTIATLLVIYTIGVFSKKGIKKMLGWGSKISARTGLICCLTGVSANIWVGVVVSNLPFSTEQIDAYAQASGSLSGTSTLIAFLTVVFFAPLLEEIIFRGLIMKNLAVITGTGTVILLQAIVFGGMHAGFIWMTYAVFLGGVLGYIRMCTGSLKASILFHIAFNGGNFAVAVLMALFGDLTMPLFLVATFVMIWGVVQISKTKPKQSFEIKI